MPAQVDNPKPPPAISKPRREMIEATGRFFQLLGLPRSTGQIYGLLYLSTKPLSLDDLVETLSISKGSASMGTRHLASWGALRQVWVQGERKDYFEAVADFKTVLSAGFNEFVKPRLNSSEKRVAGMLSDLEREEKEGLISREEFEFCQERLKALARIQKKVKTFGPLMERFLS